MRPLKIALLASRYWDEGGHVPDEEHEGGATQQLAEAVAALGHEVVVLTHSAEVGSLKKITLGKLETWASPKGRHRGLFTGIFDRMARRRYRHRRLHSDTTYLRDFLKQRGPFDVAWAPTEAPDGLVAAMAAQRGEKLPPLLVQVNGVRQRFHKQAPLFVDHTPLRLVFRKAARLLASSEILVDAMAKYADAGLKEAALRAKTQVLHPNIRQEFIRAAEESLATAPWPDRVLYLGQLDQAGGVLVFMKALLKTMATQRPASFVMTGEFNRRDGRSFVRRWDGAQDTVAAQLAAARTEYLGNVSSYEVIRQLRLASLVVVPALFSPFSRSVVEALILGRPVVTTNQVGAWSLVQSNQCGLVVPSYNSTALAGAIDQALDPASPYAENARQLSPQLAHDFSAAVIAQQMARHLSEIAGK